MIKIGLTGGICSGKSTISKLLKDASFSIIDADNIAKEVLIKYPEILERVKVEFGSHFFDWRGEFRRHEFGNHIFRFQGERIKYENIIMPYIKREIKEKFDALEKMGKNIAILDGATIIENKMDNVIIDMTRWIVMIFSFFYIMHIYIKEIVKEEKEQKRSQLFYDDMYEILQKEIDERSNNDL